MGRSLEKYREKRDFARTPEPVALNRGKKHDQNSRRFVVQAHSARRLHFDFRLEYNGELLSWAVTRGPSANPTTRRLAVRTEDHPLDYADFEGVIPNGSYGAGPVMIWDQGISAPVGDPVESFADGHLKFVLTGERVRGRWALVRLKADGAHENWLLIKDRDAFAGSDDSLAGRHARSVVSGRTFSGIVAGLEEKVLKRRTAPPYFVPFMLCDTAKTPPDGDDWQFEMKYDGYRVQISIGDDKVILRTRSGLDWTDRFPDIANAASYLMAPGTILDGEAVILNAHGISDYTALVAALGHGGAGIAFVAFDLLLERGKDLTALPLSSRRKALEQFFAKHGNGTDAIRLAPALSGKGQDLLARVTAAGGEGLIAKRVTSAYQSRRSPSWLKIKALRRIEATVIGWMPWSNYASYKPTSV